MTKVCEVPTVIGVLSVLNVLTYLSRFGRFICATSFVTYLHCFLNQLPIIQIIYPKFNLISVIIRTVTSLGGPRCKHLLWGPHFFQYLIFNLATFLNTGIIDYSAM